MNKIKCKWNGRGPGGINCSCCRVGQKRAAKRGTNRTTRRLAKLELNTEV